MKNKMTIYYETDNSKQSREVYDYIQELLETRVIHKGILNKLKTELNSNIN